MTELKDWLNSINFNKSNLIEEDPSVIKDYPPYIINRCLENCESLAGLDKKQVQRLMKDFETMKTEFVRNEEYPVL